MTFVKSTPAFAISPDCPDTAALDLGGNAVTQTSANGTGTTTGTANGASNCPQYYDNIARIVCLFWFNDISLLEGCLNQQRNAPSMLSQLTNPTDSFRQFVSSVIEYTQLLPVAVSVSLLYILRLKQLSPKAIVGNPNSEYRVFTVGLMMANKFLDDNTYTNKTWAQVTKLPLAEVSTMEIEFLSNLGYNLRIAPNEWNSWSRDLKRWLGVHKSFSQTSRKGYSPPPSFYSKFKWSGSTKNTDYEEDTPSPSSVTSLTPTYPSVSPQTPPMERKRQFEDDGGSRKRARGEGHVTNHVNYPVANTNPVPNPQNPNPNGQTFSQQFPPIQNYPMSVPQLPLPQQAVQQPVPQQPVPQQPVPQQPLPLQSQLPLPLPVQQQMPQQMPQQLPQVQLPLPYSGNGNSPGHVPQNGHVNNHVNMHNYIQPMTNIPCMPHHVSPGGGSSHVSPVSHVSPGHVPSTHVSPTHSGHVTMPNGLVNGLSVSPNGMSNGMSPSRLGHVTNHMTPNGHMTNGHVYHPQAIPPPMPYLPLAPKSLTADKFLPHPPPNQQPLYYVLSKSRDKQPHEGHIVQGAQWAAQAHVMPFGGSSPIGPAAGQRWFCPTEPSSPYSPGATYHYASPGKMRWR
ncbi:Cyclin-U4-1 [Yarrowia sp. B02]|nr:Cyclin-U4-1 [Yarrowia sp. B02]